MKNYPKRVRLLAAIIALGIVLFAGGRLYFFWRLKKTIVNQLESLRSEGIYVHYKSLDVSAWTASIMITELELRSEVTDSACSSSANIAELNVKGISILPLIFGKKLVLTSVMFNYPSIHGANNFKLPNRSKNKKGYLKELEIGQLHIQSGTLEIFDSINCTRKTLANLDFEVKDAAIHKLGQDSMIWSVTTAKASAITVEFPSQFYKMTVKQILYSGEEKLIKLDSMQLTPAINRTEFARKSGHQVDQFTCTLPKLEVNGVEIGPSYRPSFSASHVALNFRLIVFRDKRFPRAARKPKILPVRFVRQFPYPLQIDSIKISSSFISYEEFPEKGKSTGSVFFNKLEAGLYNVSNDSIRDAYMRVSSRFMNAGNLHASFMFPLTSKKPYTVQGSLTKFSMPHLNGMLMPVGNVKIESGIMNALAFQFHYNEYKSEGELEVNYADLKVVSLRKDQQKSINKFVSFLLRAFVKKEVDKHDTVDKRTGRIEWERDSQKSIINYWWKSVLSGIEAVFNLDKLIGKKAKEKPKQKKLANLHVR